MDREHLKQTVDEAYLRGLPEMALFPDDESRARAIDAIHRDQLKTPALWLGVALHAGFVFASYTLLERMFAAIPTLRPWSNGIAALLVLAVYAIFLTRSLRRDMVKELRRELVSAGVPVCVVCGYDLRGHRELPRRCPECGARVERLVREVAAESARKERDARQHDGQEPMVTGDAKDPPDAKPGGR